MNENERALFNAITADNLQIASKKLRETQNFSLDGLKQLHDSTFIPTHDLPERVRQTMLNYYPERPQRDDWKKERVDVTPFPYVTFYSPAEASDRQNAEKAISAARPENMKGLPTTEKVERLATVYAEIDYLHAYWDGNSRVNRAFVKELAAASNIELNWEQIPQKAMYAARDKSLIEMNLNRRPDELKQMRYPDRRGNVYEELTFDSEDLQRYYPSATLSSVMKQAAKEIKQPEAHKEAQTPQQKLLEAARASGNPETVKAAQRAIALEHIAKRQEQATKAVQQQPSQQANKAKENGKTATKPTEKTKDDLTR